MMFDPFQAEAEDLWLKTELGSYIFSRQARLILDVAVPATGEAVLDVGCKTGHILQLFQKNKCIVTGLDPSAAALKYARKKLGEQCELVQGSMVDLPFSDNEFDIVTLINALEINDDPQRVIAEAIRVSRERVVIGFFNKHTLVGTEQSVKRLFGMPVNSAVRFFSVGEMRSFIRKTMGASSVTWGSVGYLPRPLYSIFSEFEEIFPVQRNPLGGFVVMAFPIRYTYRTAQNPIMNSFDMEAKTHSAAPEVVRGMLREQDR